MSCWQPRLSKERAVSYGPVATKLGIFLKKAVARGKARKEHRIMPRVGIDEKAFRKGQGYIILICEFDKSTVEASSDRNDTNAANDCFSQRSQAERDGIEDMAMDMSAAYVKSAKMQIRLAESTIVHDRFHVIKVAKEAFDKVRKAEHLSLKTQGDNRLSGTKYLWLTGCLECQCLR